MIEVKNISKQFITAKKYPGFKGAIKGLFSTEKDIKNAVEDVSFSIAEGEIVGYIGSNGAGKSTTIKMMTGILTPTKGEILVNGINPSTQRKKNAAQIGVVFGQRTQLWWDLPLSETYSILKNIYRVSDEDYAKRLEFLNDVLEIQEFFSKPVRVLSLGQRMRADLGAALLHNPKILYLDEPTIGLDLVVKDNIRMAIKKMNQEFNTTVILTTHDIGDIEELCDRIIVIDQGKKIYDGGLNELKTIYGDQCQVDFEVQSLDDNYKEIILASLHTSKDLLAMDYDTKKRILSVSFDKSKIHVTDVVNCVMNCFTVSDISIQKVELGDIVKQIYQQGL